MVSNRTARRTNLSDPRALGQRSGRRACLPLALTATLVALAMLLGASTALAAPPPPGIYLLRDGFLGGERLSGDGSRVVFNRGVWTYATGYEEDVYPQPPYSFTRLNALSSDHRFAIGQRTPQADFFLVDAETNTETVVSRPDPNEYPSIFTSISPNGRYAAGSEFLEFGGGSLPEVAIWDAENGARIVERDPEFDVVTTVGITNEGVAYGSGWRDDPSRGIRSPLAGLRWNSDGEAERLAGVDADGLAWSQRWTGDISHDGARRLGFGTIEIELDDGSVGERPVTAVFDDGGATWIIQYNDDFFGALGSQYDMELSGDGSVVSVNRIGDPPLVVTEAAGVQTLETVMQLAGLDVEGWDFRFILEMSDDGRVFLAVDQVIEDFLGRPRSRSRTVLIVLPEPGTGLLLGLGLAGLASVRPRRATRSHTSDRSA
ncbi:MAG: hypothetical protein NXI30_01940 [bacterium]|nr:hypothetical protein [bacterium]